MRICHLVFTLICVVGSVPLLSVASAADGASPNFVFFLVDDLGYMDIGANNPSTFYETPNVDRIAKEGVRFTDGYAANPVCSPTRYSIQTGKYPTRVDATNFFSGKRPGRFLPAPLNNCMPVEEVTLPEALREGGYSTAFLGKWHLGPTEEFWPEAQGYDINVAGYSAGAPFKCRYYSPYHMPTIEDGPKGEHLTERLSREACGIIQDFHSQEKPFLVYLSFYTVHTPLNAPKELVAKYEKKAAALADAGDAEFAGEEQVWDTDRKREVRVRQCHATYAAMVETMDTAIGRVLKQLDALDIDDNTVVCFMADNGGLSTSEGSPTSNLPLRGGKGWLYEGGIREPFMIKWPGKTKPGSTCSVPVVSTDFYPTMLEMAGLERKPNQHLDGVSLVPLLKGGHIERDAIFWHYPHYSNQGGFPGGAVRVGNYKLVERYEDGQVHLYDLSADIGELHDLAEQQPARVADMRNRLHTWYKQVDAKLLQPKPNGPSPWRP